jgi:hypothetical protein
LVEKLPAANCALLDALTPTGNQLARWQSSQRLNVYDHCAGLMKAANQILSGRQIHSSLTTYR